MQVLPPERNGTNHFLPMATETAKLTRKYQATIPAGVRKALNLHAGETVAFDVAGGEVRLRKATPMDVQLAEALVDTLSEWATREDEEAYRDL
jgi:antitoxin PrlF